MVPLINDIIRKTREELHGQIPDQVPGSPGQGRVITALKPAVVPAAWVHLEMAPVYRGDDFANHPFTSAIKLSPLLPWYYTTNRIWELNSGP